MKRVGFALCTVLALLASAALAFDGKHVTAVPLPKVNIEQGEQCVRPTPEMRRNHMLFIQHQRDQTVRQGIRTSQYSLRNCVNCHASKSTDGVLGKNGFCQSCHTYAAVSVDCFSCHTDKREAPLELKTAAESRPAAKTAGAAKRKKP